MNLTDSEILELNALCSALVDQSLDRAGRTRLAGLVAASEEARQFYVRAMALSASLHDYAGESQCEAPERRSASARVLAFPAWRWVAGSLAAAASVLLALWIGQARPVSPAPVAVDPGGEEEIFVATLSATTDCRWRGESPQLGEDLRQGRELVLESGTAELTFDSGAQVVIEGPTAIHLTSEWEALLRHGTLRANVPPEAAGFRISNPDVEVVDLGTEFSMVTSEQGGTELFVLSGMVEARARDRVETITLHQHQARRFERAGVTEVRDREQKLKRWAGKSRLAEFAKPANYAHWSFDEADGTALIPRRVGSEPPAGAEGRWIGATEPGEPRSEGKFGRALEFKGRGEARIPLAPAGRGGRTVAFWLRLPRDAGLTAAGSIVCATDALPAEISWNRDPTRGVLGALRTRTEKGQFVGVTSLRDGQWHHVAVIVGSHGRVRHYVDGRLETWSSKRPTRRGEPHLTAAASRVGGSPELLIGGSPDSREAGRSFHGAVDELFIADRALTQSEVRQLLNENSPLRETTVAMQ